ncbi:MAG: hypothetical protein WCO72_13750 [Betaproteobacteria bacterium]
MPDSPLFDQYKLMDRKKIGAMSDSGSKEDIKETLFVAAEYGPSQMATAMLIRGLLNFKVAQATKKKTTDPERWLANLPMLCSDVNRLKPVMYINPKDKNQWLKGVDLGPYELQRFIANSSSVFQKQIPATFKALLVEVLRIPPVKGRLVDSYTAQFLCDNKLIDKVELGPALKLGTRKRPTTLEIKTFIEQFSHLPSEYVPTINGRKFDNHLRLDKCEWQTVSLQKRFSECLQDWNRYWHTDRASLNGYKNNKSWYNHVFRVLDFIGQANSPPWSNLKTCLKTDSAAKELCANLRIPGHYGSPPTGKELHDFKEFYRIKKLNQPPRESILVFLSGNQNIMNPGVKLIDELYQFNYKLNRDEDLTLLRSNLPCALPGGWMDMQYLQMHGRWLQPLFYNIASSSVKMYFAFELYWVPQGIEERVKGAHPTNLVFDDERTSFPSQGSWWVIQTVEIEIRLNGESVTTEILPLHNYSWEVFDSKPDFPKIRWPSPFS